MEMSALFCWRQTTVTGHEPVTSVCFWTGRWSYKQGELRSSGTEWASTANSTCVACHVRNRRWRVKRKENASLPSFHHPPAHQFGTPWPKSNSPVLIDRPHRLHHEGGRRGHVPPILKARGIIPSNIWRFLVFFFNIFWKKTLACLFAK